MKTSPAVPMVLGHRGFPACYPENTLLSFRKALEAGADGIECDLQKTRDGRYVVLHDDTVQRTSNGLGAVADITFDEARRLDFGAGERIPTLEETLAVVPAAKYLDLELKSETITVEDFAPIAAVLERSIDREHLMISSFEAALLYPFRRHGYTVGCLIDEEACARGATALARLVLDLRPQFLNLPVRTIERMGPNRTRLLLGFLRFLGVSVLWWTVDDIKLVEPVLGLSRILVTNDPHGVLKTLRR